MRERESLQLNKDSRQLRCAVDEALATRRDVRLAGVVVVVVAQRDQGVDPTTCTARRTNWHCATARSRASRPESSRGATRSL
jgi:hypothetical protein